MPTVPRTSNLTGNSVDILNAIRNGASVNYQNYVPYANQDISSIREIGNIIMQIPALQNEFLSALVNRIGRVLITSKMYSNPWAVLKRGMLEFGETVEEIELVGLVTNMCVLSNAVAFQGAYPNAQVVVDASLVDSFDKDLHNKTLDVLEGMQVAVVNR